METILRKHILKNETYLKKRECLFAAFIFFLLFLLSFSIFFKNITVSQIVAERKYLDTFKNLKEEYHGLEVAYLQKNGLLNKEKALESGFVEAKSVKFASREGVLVRADVQPSQ